MKRKKIFAFLLAAVMLFALAACSGENTKTESNSNTDSPDETQAAEPSESPKPETEDSKILVAYFSATGNTEGIAQQLAEGLGADLYEIVPETPYTSDDLNYSDSNSRSSVEMDDPDARPEISGAVENMGQYDVVLIGYPIWLAYHKLIQCTQLA